MTQLEDELLDLEPGESLEKGRPSLLTGLCITSWIGCGLVLLTNAYNLFFLQMNMDTTWILFAPFVLAAVCAFGVVGMWQLKKWGFFVYLLGELTPIGISFYEIWKISSYIPDQSFSSAYLFNLSGAITVLVPVTFCILYGVNYKHLK